jgi:hypothetical protein
MFPVLLLLLGVVAAALPNTAAVAAADLTAKVVSVEEGDRIVVYRNGRHETLVLKDIDCPQPKQP